MRHVALFAIDPGTSPYDINFRIGRIPVQIHPMYWLVTGILGLGAFQGGVDTTDFIIWMGVVFVSILIHELGHALAAQLAGWPPRIVLYSFGGLAIFTPTYRAPWTNIGITLAGPGAGFALAILTFIILVVAGYQPSIYIPNVNQPQGEMVLFHLFEVFFILSPQGMPDNLHALVWYMFYVNILWGLVNLLPIFPLDGGQISRELLEMGNGRAGTTQALQLSFVCAVGMAIVGIAVMKSMFVAILFGMIAYQNWVMLQQLSGYGGGGWGGGGGSYGGGFRRWR